jgi:hypothetical protein
MALMVNLEFGRRIVPQVWRKIRIKMEDLAKGRMVRCARRHSIELHDKDGGARKAQRALDDLEKSLQKIDKKVQVLALRLVSETSGGYRQAP